MREISIKSYKTGVSKRTEERIALKTRRKQINKLGKNTEQSRNGQNGRKRENGIIESKRKVINTKKTEGNKQIKKQEETNK